MPPLNGLVQAVLGVVVLVVLGAAELSATVTVVVVLHAVVGFVIVTV